MMNIKKIAKKQNLHLFILTTIILFYGVFSFFGDVTYFFSSRTPLDLGTAFKPNKQALKKVKEGDFVKIKGITSMFGGKVKKGFWGTEYVIYSFSASTKFIIIEKKEKGKKYGPSDKTVEGRIHPFKTNKQAAKMREFFKKSLFTEMDKDGYLIEAGVTPQSKLFGTIIFFIFLTLFIFDIYLLIKPPKKEEEDDEF